MLATELVLGRTRLDEFVCQGSRSVLLRVSAAGPGDPAATLTGSAKVDPGAGADRDALWAALVHLADRLDGVKIDVAPRVDDSGLPELFASLRMDEPAADPDGMYGAALAGIEVALLGLTAAAAGVPPETFGGGTATAGAGTVTRVAKGWPDVAGCVQYLTRSHVVPPGESQPLVHAGLPANTYDVPPVRRGSLPSHLLERAALVRGLDTERFSAFVVTASHPDFPGTFGFLENKGAWSGSPSHTVTGDKELTREILRRADVPAMEGAAFERGDADGAVAYAESLGGPVVVKPRSGRKGIGVSTELRTAGEIRRAVERIEDTQFAAGGFVVERFTEGNDYRMYVLGDRVLSVVLRRPASVVGDGRSTVTDLVLDKNLARLANPQMRTLLIPLGDDAAYWLERQGLTTGSVPDDGQVVRLGSAANVSSGGDSIEVLDRTHPSLLEFAVRAAHAVPGLDHAGIDLIGDHERGAAEAPAAIIEVNGSPVTDLHHFPLFGPPRDVSAELVLRSCELAGISPGEPRDRLEIEITAQGRVQGVGYRRWFARQAQRYGVAGSVANVDTGRVVARVAGPADGVTRLATLAFTGPRGARVQSVVARQTAGVAPQGRFEVVA